LIIIEKSFNIYDIYLKKRIKKHLAGECSGVFLILQTHPTNQYFIIDTKKEIINITPTPNPLWGGKIVYHIDYEFINKIGGLDNMKNNLSDFYFSKLGL
jgi:hypothetical protein